MQGDAQYAALVAFDDAGAILWKCVGDARAIFEAAAWTADGSVALIGHASPNPQSVWEDYEFFAIYKGGEKVSQVDYAPDTLETQGGMRPACCYTLAMLVDGDGYLIARKEMMENDLELQRLDATGAHGELDRTDRRGEQFLLQPPRAVRRRDVFRRRDEHWRHAADSQDHAAGGAMTSTALRQAVRDAEVNAAHPKSARYKGRAPSHPARLHGVRRGRPAFVRGQENLRAALADH